MSGIYDVTLSASSSAAAQVGALGSYIKVTSAPQGAVVIRLDGGEAFRLLEGQGLRLRDGQTFRDVQVNNASGIAQTVLLFIGDSRFEDTRITGVVSVLDQGATKTLQGKQFFGSIDGPASVGNFTHVNLQVVSGSLAVKALSVQSSIAGRVAIATSTAPGTSNPVGGGGNANKMLNGGAAANHRGQQGTSTTIAPSGAEIPGYTIRQFIYVPANQMTPIPLTTPLIITGTAGLILSGYAANRDISLVHDSEEF